MHYQAPKLPLLLLLQLPLVFHMQASGGDPVRLQVLRLLVRRGDPAVAQQAAAALLEAEDPLAEDPPEPPLQ